MSQEYTLSLAQIAQRLNGEGHDIADSTVRKYARLYKEYLPSRKLEGERWVKYPFDSVEIIRRIFVQSNGGKSRHEIKAGLDAEGLVKTLEGEAGEPDATVNEPAQSYDHTPSASSPQHNDDIPNLPQRYSDMIARYNESLSRSAIASLELHRTLLQEKDIQLKELEGLTKRLKEEKQELEQKFKDELSKVLDHVVQWKARHVDRETS
jgi:hypothetical protein